MAPALPTDSIWAMGSRTVRAAIAETGLSRQLLWELMDEGRLAWQPHSLQRPRKPALGHAAPC